MHVLVLLAALLFYRTYYNPVNNESSNTMSVSALMSEFLRENKREQLLYNTERVDVPTTCYA